MTQIITSNKAILKQYEKIQKTGDQIEVYSKMTQEAVDKMCNCIYGVDGREGIVSKITKLFEEVYCHFV